MAQLDLSSTNLVFFIVLLVNVGPGSPSAIVKDPFEQYKPGIIGMYYFGFTGNDFRRGVLYSLKIGYFTLPTAVTRIDKFESEALFSTGHLGRNVAYFIAPVSGIYKFLLVCKNRCQIAFNMYSCDTEHSWFGHHTVVNGMNINNYRDPSSEKQVELAGKYRYCIEVLQRGSANAQNWIGVGVIYPNGTEEIPLKTTFHIPDLIDTIALSWYYIDNNKEPDDIMSIVDCPGFPMSCESKLPGGLVAIRRPETVGHSAIQHSSHRLANQKNYVFSYHKFWYLDKGNQHFRGECHHCYLSVAVDGNWIPGDKLGKFQVSFSGQETWKLFEMFKYTSTKHEKEALKLFIYDKDDKKQNLDNKRASYINPAIKEHRRMGGGYGLTSTSLKATIDATGLTTPVAPPFVLQSYILHMSGGGDPSVVREFPKDTKEQTYIDLKKYTTYHFSVDYVSSTYIVRSDTWYAHTLEDLPTAEPLNLKSEANSSTSVKLTWDQIIHTERNGVIRWYPIKYAQVANDGKTINELSWQDGPTSNHHRVHTVGGLEFWTFYAFKIAGQTNVGIGPYTEPSIVRTMEDAPTGGAQNVLAYNTSESSLFVSWEHLLEADRNGVIIGYQVKYTKGGDPQTKELSGKDTLSTTLTGLTYFCDYEISVAGQTKVNYGVHSTPIIVRTDEWKPERPPTNVRGEFISGTELKIEFDDLADPVFLYGYPVGSKVKWKRIDKPTENGETFGGINQCIIEGLNEYTIYEIEVAILTRYGGETFSAPIEVRTDETPPSAPPKSIRARSKSSTSINIYCKLIEPDDRNGIVLRYNFTVREQGVGAAWEEHMVDENDGEKDLELTGLEKWRYYEYMISGCTNKGCGVASGIKIVRTLQDIPENVPANIRIHSTSSTTLNVTWDEVPEGTRRGIITKYMVKYADTTNDPLVWLEKEVEAPLQHLYIEELKFYTYYAVQVKARTKVDYGDYSIVYENRTLEDVPEKAPYNFTCNNETSSSIKCSWEEVEEIHGYANGKVLGYNIYYSVMDCAKAELADCNETIIFKDVVYAPLKEHVITGLDNFTEYYVYIDLFNGMSPGPNTSSEMVIITDEDIPSTPPSQVEGFTETTTSVLVYWDGVPWGEKHGIILGYIVYYRRMNAGPPADYLRALAREKKGSKRKRRSIDGDTNFEPIHEDFQDDPPHKRERRSTQILYDGKYIYPEMQKIVINATSIGTRIENLTKYEWYTIRVAAFTSKGHGPTFDFNVSCAQEVPWTAPIVSIYDRYSFDQITINWTKLTYNESRGTVFDYNIVYYPVQVHGVDLSPFEQEETSIWLEYPIQKLIIKNLKPYVKYAVRTAALTFAGVGVYSREYFGETCRCNEYFYTAYRNLPPYFWFDPDTAQQDGIMKNMVNEATQICCQSCTNGHGQTIVDWAHDKLGNDSLKKDMVDIRSAILAGTEFALPVNTEKTRLTVLDKPFVSLVESAGVTVFSRKIEYIDPTANMMLYAATIIWSFVVLFTLAVLALGFFMWVLQCNPLFFNRTNQKDFPDDFRHGAGAGAWWAVSSMTRLGYGDVVATGTIGRLFSMPIILLGLVMCSVLISGMCTMYLSYVYVKSEGGVFSKKIVTLEDSYDTKSFIRKGAKVSVETTSVKRMMDELRNGRADRIVVDSLFGTYHSDQMSGDDVIFRGTYSSKSSQGIVLSGGAVRLKECFKQYFSEEKPVISERMKAIVDNDNKTYADDEYESKRLAVSRYESHVWMLFIQICGGLFLGALLIGIIYECKQSKKNRIYAYTLVHTRCGKFFESEIDEIFREFNDRLGKKVEKIEVKHAFQRIDLIRNLRKRVEWLTPDQVNKYKF